MMRQMRIASKNLRKSDHDLVGGDCSSCSAALTRSANSAYGAFTEISGFKYDLEKSAKYAMYAEMRLHR